MALNAEQSAKLNVVSAKPYHEQAQFVLNAFWPELQDKAEHVWQNWVKFKDLDRQQFNALVAAGKATGDYIQSSSLDEFWSHKYLENQGKTLSIVEFRNEFKKIDANVDKRMGLLEYLVYEFKLSVAELLKRPQGGDPEEIAKAQQLLEDVSAAFASAQSALDQASKTEAEAKRSKEAAIKSEHQAKASAASAKAAADAAAAAHDLAKVAADAASHAAAQAKKTAEDAAEKSRASEEAAAAAAAAAAEQKQAVDALKHEEDAYKSKTAQLQEESEKGGVSGMKAKNELAQHLAKDPLPLSKAKLTAEAAAKKAEKFRLAAEVAAEPAKQARLAAEKDAKAAAQAQKQAEADAAAAQQAKHEADQARKKAEEAATAAEQDRLQAEAAAEQAENDRVAAEERVKESEAKLAEAEAYLNEVKSRSDKTFGTFWWLDRELAERKKFMPKSGKAKLLF